MKKELLYIKQFLLYFYPLSIHLHFLNFFKIKTVKREIHLTVSNIHPPQYT